MSGAHPGSHKPVLFWYKPTHFGREIIPTLEVIRVTSRRKRNRNLSRLLKTLVLNLSDFALVSASFGFGYRKKIIFVNVPGN